MSVEEFKREIEALRAEYRAELPGRLAELDGLWRDIANGRMGIENIADLRRCLHSLAGSAQTFGVAGVSEAAAAAESWIEPYCVSKALPGPAEQPEFQRLLDEVKRAAL